VSDATTGLIDNWRRIVRDTQDYFWKELAALDEAARFTAGSSIRHPATFIRGPT